MADRAERESRRVIDRARVVGAGVDHFLRRSTLDMEVLAVELAVSRATLYRVAHSRYALLSDVLRALTLELLRRSRAARTRDGFDGVVEVSREFGEMLEMTVVEAFLKQDPETAERILISPAGPVHRSAVGAQLESLAETGLLRQLRPDADPAHLAHLYVRMVGTYLYAEFFTGRRADFDDLIPALRSLLFQEK